MNVKEYNKKTAKLVEANILAVEDVLFSLESLAYSANIPSAFEEEIPDEAVVWRIFVTGDMEAAEKISDVMYEKYIVSAVKVRNGKIIFPVLCDKKDAEEIADKSGLEELLHKTDSEYKQKKEQKLKPIAVYGLCNTVSVNIYEIEYDTTDKVLAGINNGEPAWCSIFYEYDTNSLDELAFFCLGELKVPLSECMRV